MEVRQSAVAAMASPEQSSRFCYGVDPSIVFAT